MTNLDKLPTEIKLMIIEYIPFNQSKELYNEFKLQIPIKIIKRWYSSNIVPKLQTFVDDVIIPFDFWLYNPPGRPVRPYTTISDGTWIPINFKNNNMN
jgi:hypothetical protein